MFANLNLLVDGLEYLNNFPKHTSEISRIQEERSERHKYKNVLRERGSIGSEPIDMMPDIGSYDTGDPNTTNLYLGNLNPKVTWIFFQSEHLG